MTQPPPGGGAQQRPEPETPLQGERQAPQVDPPSDAGAGPTSPVRHLLWSAKKDAKPIVALWLIPTKTGCDLHSDVYPLKSLRVDPVKAGPYQFRRAEDAQAFAQEAARALMHLGCEILENERSGAPPAPITQDAGLRVTPPDGA